MLMKLSWWVSFEDIFTLYEIITVNLSIYKKQIILNYFYQIDAKV